MSALEDIQEVICAANEELKFWLAILPFKGVVIQPKDQEEVDSDNILKYVTNSSHMGVKVWFPVAKYPPGDFMSEGRKKLKKYLETILFDNRTSVVSNGGGKKQCIFRCACFECYQDWRKLCKKRAAGKQQQH
jgi:hypothetical protein